MTDRKCTLQSYYFIKNADSKPLISPYDPLMLMSDWIKTNKLTFSCNLNTTYSTAATRHLSPSNKKRELYPQGSKTILIEINIGVG